MTREPTYAELNVAASMFNAEGPMLWAAAMRLPEPGRTEIREVWLKRARAAIAGLVSMSPAMRHAGEKAMTGLAVSKDNVARVYWPAAVNAASPPLDGDDAPATAQPDPQEPPDGQETPPR